MTQLKIKALVLRKLRKNYKISKKRKLRLKQFFYNKIKYAIKRFNFNEELRRFWFRSSF